VAPQLIQILDGAVLVAHNVRFDHGFVQNELARLDIALKTKTLCTVRLSRKLYPQHKGHGLDALLQRHGLHTEMRHRAMGDVEVVLAWLQVATAELGMEQVQREADALLQGSASAPPNLETSISDIPETAGVYLFYGEGTLPLYVGKSVNLRSRVVSHFQSATKVAREMRILQEIRRVEWRETASELGALLLESRLVKELQPVYNRRLRRERELFAWKRDADPGARPLLRLVRMEDMSPQEFEQLYGVYRSRRQATDALRLLAQTHGLCPQALGLESGKGACFAHQIGQCKGVCVGRETPALHHVRLLMALAAHKLLPWPHTGPVAIREHDARSGRTDIHVFDHWCHLTTVHDHADLEHALQTRQPLAFDLDIYRILGKRLAQPAGSGPDLFRLHRPN
jgi:DNA polymerase-3 subunit epsilon